MPQNDIGEKIKRLRIHRKMTQSELAGDQITRNMLSRVENGAALPSLPTVWYLADQLDVPAGFLLAEGDDDHVWRKMSRIDSIRRLLAAGDHRVCLDVCLDGAEQDEADDEIDLIKAQCSLALAMEALEHGRLHECCSLLDDAVTYADHTVYDTVAIRATAKVCFRFMHRLSASLYSETLRDTDDLWMGGGNAFCRYVLACESLEAGETRLVESYLRTADETDGWAMLFRARVFVREGDYLSAQPLLEELLRSDHTGGEVQIYCAFCELEICCRELGDFKGAYEYSQNKMALLERMLEK